MISFIIGKQIMKLKYTFLINKTINHKYFEIKENGNTVFSTNISIINEEMNDNMIRLSDTLRFFRDNNIKDNISKPVMLSADYSYYKDPSLLLRAYVVHEYGKLKIEFIILHTTYVIYIDDTNIDDIIINLRRYNNRIEWF